MRFYYTRHVVFGQALETTEEAERDGVLKSTHFRTLRHRRCDFRGKETSICE